MSGTAPRLKTPLPLPAGTWPKGRSPLAHLLHALNQPLTGLQCALELAVASPRPPVDYVRILREALELASRMRTLVEAIRELVSLQEEETGGIELCPLDALLRETVEDLRPVAETRSVHILVALDTGLLVQADRAHLTTLTFRLLESALSLAGEGSELRVTARRERERVIVVASWSPGLPAERSPLSRPELGLLVARAAWERAGGEWISTQAEKTQTSTVRLSFKAAAPRMPEP